MRLRSLGDAALPLRMGGWACALPLLKRRLPLPRLAALMWRDGQAQVAPDDVARIARIAQTITRLRPLPGRDNCLERSLLAYRYLSGVGAKPRLVASVRSSGELIEGHVWVTLDGEPVFPEDVSSFAPVIELGERGERIETPRSD